MDLLSIWNWIMKQFGTVPDPMEEIFFAFPHVGDQILKYLGLKDLHSCRGVNKAWKHFMEVEQTSSKNIIKTLTNCSDDLLSKICEKRGNAYTTSRLIQHLYKNVHVGPLHEAAAIGSVDACKLVMEAFVDKNLIANGEGHTPLHAAAFFGHLSVCKLIMENVQDVHPRTNTQKSPLHYAALNGHLNVCLFYLCFEGWQDLRDVDGATPFHFAARNGHVNVCEMFIKKLFSSDKEPRTLFWRPHFIMLLLLVTWKFVD